MRPSSFLKAFWLVGSFYFLGIHSLLCQTPNIPPIDSNWAKTLSPAWQALFKTLGYRSRYPTDEKADTLRWWVDLNELQSFNLYEQRARRIFDSPEGLQPLSKFPKLKSISIYANDEDTVPVRILKDLATCGQVSSLDLNITNIPLDALPFLPSLKALTIRKGYRNYSDTIAGGSSLADCSFFKNMPNLTHLDIEYIPIISLYGIQHLNKLMYLNIKSCKTQNISGLEACKKLKQVTLWNNNLQDISPFKGLDSLEELSLSNCEIQDISPLGFCKNLSRLDLSNNNIQDLSPLAFCKKLYKLDLSNNHIKNLSPLVACKSLSILHLSHNQIQDLSPLAKLKRLWHLEFENNQVKDLSAFKDRKLSIFVPWKNPLNEFQLFRFMLYVHNNYHHNLSSSAITLRYYNPFVSMHYDSQALLKRPSPMWRSIRGVEFEEPYSGGNMYSRYLIRHDIEDEKWKQFLNWWFGLSPEWKEFFEPRIKEHLHPDNGEAFSDYLFWDSIDYESNLLFNLASAIEMLTISTTELSPAMDTVAAFDSETFEEIAALHPKAYPPNLDALRIFTNLETLCLGDSLHLDDFKTLATLPKLKTIYANNLDSCAWDGFKLLPNIQHLECKNNKLQHLDFLSNCHQLDYLNASNNQIQRLLGLTNAHKLRVLHVPNNQLQTLKGLEKDTNLIQVTANKNQLSNLRGLENARKLLLLNIDNNQLSDISPVANAQQLLVLRASSNKLKKIPFFPNLHTLDLRPNPFADFSCLYPFKNLRQLYPPKTKTANLQILKKQLPKCEVIAY